MPALTPANDLIRSRNVSASECYALLGKHPYASRQSIYDRLTSPASFGHPEQSQAMSLGVYFEPYIAAYAAKKYGLKLRANVHTREHPAVNLCATPDYIILKSNMLLEVKLSGITYGWTEDSLHPWYEYQARAQMACTNRDTVIIAALVGSSFYFIPVTRDPVKERRLTDAVEEFMSNHVLPGVRPADDDAKLIAQVKASWKVETVENFKATVEEVVPVLAPGVYPAMFAKIEEQTNDNGTYWLLTFVAEDGNNDVEITATTSPRITPKTKMGKWLTTMLGRPVQVGENVDFAALVGVPVQILVAINDTGYSRIENVLPRPKK